MHPDYDVLIIGGGVFGTAIAERLSRTDARVCLAEARGDVAEGASKGNAGVTSSYFSSPGTLDAQLVSASSPRWEEICENLDVPFRRMGSVMAAVSDEEERQLRGYYEEAVACGARAELLTADRALQQEPLLSPNCRGALYLPDEGIIDPMRLTCAFAELAAINGCDVRVNSPVIEFERKGGRLVAAVTPSGGIGARHFINASGLHADTISRLANGDEFRMWPRKGQYWVLDRAFGAQMAHIVDAVPAPDGISKGIHVIPTSKGSVLLGPTAEDREDRYDASTDEATLLHAFERAKLLVPSISLDHAIKTYSGLRPASDEPFFVRRDKRVENLIHAVSRSIGVSSAPGVADFVYDLLRKAGLKVQDQAGKATKLPRGFHLRYCDQPEQQQGLTASDQTVICVCEQVTAAEINRALTSKVPARSIEGVWKRTGATGGRCQGSLCLTGVAFLCSVQLGCAPHQVPVKDEAPLGIATNG